MNPLIPIYIDTSKSPRVASVNYPINNSPKDIPPAFEGDNIRLCLVFVNNNTIDTTISGDATYQITASIGTYSTGPLVKTTTFYTSASYGFTGSLNLATGSLTSSLNGLQQLNTNLEIVAKDAQGNKRTYLQAPFIVWNAVAP